jgi:hypothetical protein
MPALSVENISANSSVVLELRPNTWTIRFPSEPPSASASAGEMK